MITVKADSVGGQQCLIFYKGTKPVYTLWYESFKHNSQKFRDLQWSQYGELHGDKLHAIVETTRALGGDWDQVNAAVTAYVNNLQEK